MPSREGRPLLPATAPPSLHRHGSSNAINTTHASATAPSSYNATSATGSGGNNGGAGIARRRPRLLQRPRKTSIRHDIWTVLRYRSSATHRNGLQLASYVLELCILTLVLLNVVLAISESSSLVTTTAGPRTNQQSEWYQTFLLVSTVIFSFEYALRFWSCVEDERYNSAIFGRLKWMTQPMSVIDLLALVPFYLEIVFEFMVIPAYPGALTLRSLRLLRIVSFLRLERSYSAMTNLRLIFSRKKEELLVVTYLTAVLVLTSSTTIFFLENAAQPTVFYSVGASAWWSVETITSLGYGDMVPQTTAGKLFGAVLALWGIILFTIPGAILGSAFIEVMLEQQKRDEEDVLSVMMRSSFENQPFTANPSASGLFSRQVSEVDQDRGSFLLNSPLSQSANSFRRPSPRVAAVLRVDALALKVDEMAAAQTQMAQHLAEQNTQIEELRRLLEILVARSE